MRLKTGIAIDLRADNYCLEAVGNIKMWSYTFIGSERYVKANNKHLEDYDETVESNYLLYIDAHMFMVLLCVSVYHIAILNLIMIY